MATPAGASPELRLPGFFPRIKGCERVGTAFLTCFTTKAVKEGEEDVEAGVRGLKACVRELSSYEACMQQQEVKTAARRYRVQEEYRIREAAAAKDSKG